MTQSGGIFGKNKAKFDVLFKKIIDLGPWSSVHNVHVRETALFTPSRPEKVH